MYLWKEFEEGEVRSEFKEIRDLNLKVVRVFLIWEDFQPEPRKVDRSSLDKLEALMDAANRYGLKVIPTLIVGFMSGINWAPKWALDESSVHTRYPTASGGRLLRCGVRDIYEDPDMLKAERLLVREVASRLREHPALLVWDISNEVDNFKLPKSCESARRWVEIMYREIKGVDPAHPVTLGMHQENLEYDKGFRVSEVSAFNDFLCMHGYSVFSDWCEGPLDSDVVPFLSLLARELGGKPVLFEEFGMPTSPPGRPSESLGKVRIFKKEVELFLASEEEAARYYREVLDKLHRAGSLGALAWDFSDYDPCIYERPCLRALSRYEQSFGLTRADGNVKPSGEVIKEFASEAKEVTRPDVDLKVDVENYYRSPNLHLREAFRRFKEAFK